MQFVRVQRRFRVLLQMLLLATARLRASMPGGRFMNRSTSAVMIHSILASKGIPD